MRCLRQRALNAYEEGQEEWLAQFEIGPSWKKTPGFRREFNEICAKYQARLEAGLGEIAREKESFREWRKRKDRETQRIAEAASHFGTPGGKPVATADLALLLEKVTRVNGLE